MRLTGGQNPGKSPEDEATEYKKKTEAAKAKSDYVVTVDTLANPPSVQVMREKREQELIDQGKAAATRAQDLEDREHTRLEKDAQDAAAAAATEQQKREQVEKALQDQHNQMLLDKLEELKQSQKPFSEQAKEFFAFAQEAATMLGFEKPSTVKPTTEDPKLALDLAKMNLDLERWKIEQEAKKEQDKFDRELKLLEFKDNREFKQKELDLQAKKDEQLFSFPQIIGGAIAKGLIEHEARGAAPPGSISQRQQSTGKSYRFEIGQGQGGEAQCPNCQSPIGIGPTSTEVQCVGCGRIFPVVRVAGEPGGQVPPPTEGEE